MTDITPNLSPGQDNDPFERIRFQLIIDVREYVGGVIVRDAQGAFWMSYDNAKELRDCLTQYLKHGKKLIDGQHKAGLHRLLNPSREPRPKPERKPKPGYIYLLRSEVGHYKIGMTASPEKRLHTFGVKLPFRVEYTCLIQTDDTIGLERQLQRKFGEKRLDGEWFDLTPEDVEYIKGLSE